MKYIQSGSCPLYETATGDAERNKLFGPKWLFDMYRCSQLDQTQFLDAASHLVFSAAPGIYATHRLLDWSAYLHTGVEGRFSSTDVGSGRRAT